MLGNYREVSITTCQELITTHHYSHRMPAKNTFFCYADVEYGPPKVIHACCTFSLAGGRWEEEIWELTRLVRTPEYPLPLSRLISKALGEIRQRKLTDFILSLADIEEDHHGGIYQSCSWYYDGLRGNRLDGFNIDGRFYTARFCNFKWGTSSEVELPKLLPGKEVLPHYDSGKHCYWKPLSKDGLKRALRLGFQSLPYPKPLLVNGSNRGTLPGHMGKGQVLPPKKGSVRVIQEIKKVEVGEDVPLE